ncbi:hypothetical protein ACIN8IBEIGE_20112 [Acinetobacter sp. 8I-beige]|nr:hypothetical protein ACIN8IBEIGE_20112 [Acinetobacter sp. 8I-beige]
MLRVVGSSIGNCEKEDHSIHAFRVLGLAFYALILMLKLFLKADWKFDFR